MGGYYISFPTWCLEWGGSRGYAATEAGDIVKNKKTWDLYFGPLMDFRGCCCWHLLLTSTYISTLLLSSQFLRRNRRWRVDQTPIPKASTAVGTFSIRRTSLRTSKSMSSKMFTCLLFPLFATPSVKSRFPVFLLLSSRSVCHVMPSRVRRRLWDTLSSSESVICAVRRCLLRAD